jgi:hypothetical protein
MTSEELKAMSEMTFDDVDSEDMIELGSLKFDMEKPPEERVKKLLSLGKNPYFRRTASGSKIKISFAENGRSFEDNMVNLLSSHE